MRLALINPNTNSATTQAMLDIAREAAAGQATLDGLTAGFGVPLICDEASLQVAADAVLALAPALRRSQPAGVIVAAFGDPGRADLGALLNCPVVGIAQAGMAQAAQGGRRFSVVTTTPDLERAILRTAQRYGVASQCLGVRLTPGDPRMLMADPGALEASLLCACEQAIDEDAAQAIVIGGGPLATAARALAQRLPVPLIEPVPAAVQLLLSLLAGAGPHTGR